LGNHLPRDIAKQVGNIFQNTKLSGKQVLITLGATIEAIDPVRYLSNHSSGKMGSALDCLTDVFI
jgi:phosphopantothenoylcysteine decarboxylase/phosphopantothenate--cysteine ligase